MEYSRARLAATWDISGMKYFGHLGPRWGKLGAPSNTIGIIGKIDCKPGHHVGVDIVVRACMVFIWSHHTLW